MIKCLLLLLLLPSCMQLFPETDPKQKVLVLNPGPVVVADQPAVSWQLIIPRPTAAAYLNTSMIVVNDGSPAVEYVGGAIWSDDVLDMTQDLLADAFLSSGKIRGVGKSVNTLKADYILLVDINEFGLQVGALPDQPKVVVEFTVQLVEAETRSSIAVKTFRQQEDAAAPQVDVVAEAFNRALKALFPRLLEWTFSLGKKDLPNPKM